MEERSGSAGDSRTVYCVVPPELASKLAGVLRDHYRDDPLVEVIVGRTPNRRAVRGVEEGRRLPREARRHASRITFVSDPKRVELDAADAEADRLVERYHAGESEALGELYRRYFDMVYGYARVALRNQHEAENVAQDVFAKLVEALMSYQVLPGQPFRAWLMRITRNTVIDVRKRPARITLTDPAQLEATSRSADPVLDGSWLEDVELERFVGMLPEAQREVLVMRYMLGFDFPTVAAILDKQTATVHRIHSRALRTLEQRLTEVGRRRRQRRPMASSRTGFRVAPVVLARRRALAGLTGGALPVTARGRHGGWS